MMYRIKKVFFQIRKTIGFFSAIILIFFLACSKSQPQAIHITVLDNDFSIVNNIDDPRLLDEFDKLWVDRTRIASSDDRTFMEKKLFLYKVDIRTKEDSTRWLFDPEGYATVLSKAIVPVYHFHNPEKLKEILIKDAAR